MSNRLSVLMTVYNEAEFVEYAIRACLPYVDDLVIVEGAYQETIDVGGSPRSTDGTVRQIKDTLASLANGFRLDENEFNFDEGTKAFILYANEQTDKDQRNVGLQKIKELNPDGWLLIIDGDEVYSPENFQMVKVCMKNMERQNAKAAYFRSLTFVNDLKHYAEQDFPRLFKITPDCEFTNDNFMKWGSLGWGYPHVIKIPYVQYHHYAFCKGAERFELKKKWWETRFGKSFDYGWQADKDGLISDNNHEIREYTKKHPKIMEGHPKWKEVYGA